VAAAAARRLLCFVRRRRSSDRTAVTETTPVQAGAAMARGCELPLPEAEALGL